MHTSSLQLMEQLIPKYIPTWDTNVDVADIGSYNVNGCYRPLVEKYGWEYTGVDICAGPNVDIVIQENNWSAVTKNFDLVISGQCLEHVKAPWEWILRIKSICKYKGFIIIIAPWQWGIHKHPVDCWRILPDGMAYLIGPYAGLDVLEVGYNETDCWGVAQKC